MANNTQNILIYCPNTGGHRHMCAKAFVDYFLQKDSFIVFAHCGLLKEDGETMSFVDHHSAFLDSFQNHSKITMVSLKERFQKNNQLHIIYELQKKYLADVTVIIDGDAIQWQLATQIIPWKRKLLSKTIAVFMLSEFIHPSAVSLIRLFEQWFLHAFLFKHKKMLDNHIWMDEILIKSLQASHYSFVPDIICDPDPSMISAEDKLFAQRISDRLDMFLQHNKSKTPILVFGEWEPRKRNDFIFRLAELDRSLAIIRVGRIKPSMRYHWELTLAIETLLKQERLLDVPCYIGSPELIHKLFRTSKIIALPYKNFYRTSGNMLYAISNGKPVLVPNTGLLKYRTLEHKVGLVFNHSSFDSFKKQFYSLLKNADNYVSATNVYSEQFSIEAVYAAFDYAIYRKSHSNTYEYYSNLPQRTLGELIFWRIYRITPVLRPVLKWMRNIFLKQTNLLKAIYHEKYVQRIWKRLQGKRILLFGAGQHTIWLWTIIGKKRYGPTVIAIMDDNPDTSNLKWPVPIIHPDKWEPDDSIEILLSSDTKQNKMRSRCKMLFGEKIKIIDLYQGLPPGPYHKRKTMM